MSPLLQLLEQIALQQHEVKALAHNQVKVQPKTKDVFVFVFSGFETKIVYALLICSKHATCPVWFNLLDLIAFNEEVNS
jgi:hypothetical protein